MTKTMGQELVVFGGHHHDTVHGQSVEALAFQIAAQVTYDWPGDVVLDSFTALLIEATTRERALTVRLREMADR